VELAAVDASFSDALKKIGYIVWDQDRELSWEEGRVAKWVCSETHQQSTIAIAELRAIHRCVKDIQARSSTRRPQLIVMLTDSMNAKAWVERGYSIHKETNDILDEIVFGTILF